MSVTYNTESLIAGPVETRQVKLAADTYYKGMPLAYTAGTDSYGYDATASTLAAIYMEDESRVLSSAGYGTVIVGGDIYQGGLVDDSNAALTVDEDFIAAVGPRGFFIKRT
jgi:hypothetical protein